MDENKIKIILKTEGFLMPFTPFHVGPHATVGFAFQKYIDVPVFVLSNIAVDLEPLVVILFKIPYPLHGFFHTFLFGGLVGFCWGLAAVKLTKSIGILMNKFWLGYSPTPFKKILSGVLGVWFHILFDAPIYKDIKPFFPYEENPLYGLVYLPNMYYFCLFFFIPATILYIFAVLKNKKESAHAG